jgi:hypothetical protein
VNDVRMIRTRPQAEIRLRRRSISHQQVEQARHRAWLEASLPRIGL